MKEVVEFENYKIKECSIQFPDESAVAFGCAGTMDATANINETVKKCEGKTVKKAKTVVDITVALTGYAKAPISRKIMGLSNKGLKTGVYGYGSESFSKPFVFAAKVFDMEGKVKYIAFSNLEDVKGLSLKVNNDTTEIEMDDFEFTALADSNEMFYYEAFEDELEDETVKEQWLTNFTPALVKSTEQSNG